MSDEQQHTPVEGSGIMHLMVKFRPVGVVEGGYFELGDVPKILIMLEDCPDETPEGAVTDILIDATGFSDEGLMKTLQGIVDHMKEVHAKGGPTMYIEEVKNDGDNSLN